MLDRLKNALNKPGGSLGPLPIVVIMISTVLILAVWQPDLGTLAIALAIGGVLTAILLWLFYRSVRASRDRQE